MGGVVAPYPTGVVPQAQRRCVHKSLLVFVLTQNVYLDDVEKRDQVVGSNHPETVTVLGHST
jgi:hypothetical protein